nr:hypothetical protein [Tanacetum cinerariifolium]
ANWSWVFVWESENGERGLPSRLFRGAAVEKEEEKEGKCLDGKKGAQCTMHRGLNVTERVKMMVVSKLVVDGGGGDGVGLVAVVERVIVVTSRMMVRWCTDRVLAAVVGDDGDGRWHGDEDDAKRVTMAAVDGWPKSCRSGAERDGGEGETKGCWGELGNDGGVCGEWCIDGDV